jgi:peptide deformylase
MRSPGEDGDVELRYYPDRILKRRCPALREVTDEVVARAHEMLDFMYEADGVGLAAPQVGWPVRLLTLDVEASRQGRRIYLNPRIARAEGEVEEDEGCLSLPGMRVAVPRAARIEIVAYTLKGEPVEMAADGLLARAWQHEMDHLNGLLIVDRLSPTRLMAVRDQLKRLEQEAAEPERR